MSKLPTDSVHHDSRDGAIEPGGVFKSGDVAVHRLSEGSNSAVSGIAVERSVELPRAAEEHESSGMTPITRASSSRDEPVENPVTVGTFDTMQSAIAKADALMETVAQRQSQIEEAQHKAEATLAEVNRIAAALTFSDALRERINATVARTRRLRSENGK